MGKDIYDLIVAGGGASGFFCAINVALRDPDFSILILEKSPKLLSKVRISGGGRCNVTHDCFNPFKLASHYPRGEKFLRDAFKIFQASDMVEWLRNRGVETKVEEDGRMFPVSNSSETIIDCFLREATRLNIRIELNNGLEEVIHRPDGIAVSATKGIYKTRNLLIAFGGNPALSFYRLIAALGHTIKPPVPSLFTFNDRDKEFTDLMGVSVQDAEVRIIGSKFSERGPVLITHWGLSGPAVIRLSAWAATYVKELNYQFAVSVNWIAKETEASVHATIATYQGQKGKQRVISNQPFRLPARLWEKLCVLAQIPDGRTWGELSKKHKNRLVEYLVRCPFNISGKTTYKEEFVTCGGVELNEINPLTMESRKQQNIYFAGEVIDIDGETGGFNFQAAWTTAYIAAVAIAGVKREVPAPVAPPDH